MLKHKWMPTKIATQSHELEDGLQEDNCLIQTPWTHQLEEPGEGSQDQKKSTTIHPHICHKEGLCKEEEEEDAPIET